MKIIFPLFFVALLPALISCNQGETQLSMVKVQEVGVAKMEDLPVKDLLKTKNDIVIDLSFATSEEKVIDQVEKKKIDLAVIPNEVDFVHNIKNIRTIMALLPRIVMITYHKKIPRPKSLEDLLTNRTVVFEKLDTSDELFFSHLLSHFGIDKETDFKSIYLNEEDFDDYLEKDSIKIFITLSHLKNALIHDLLENNHQLFSLDDPELYLRGSSVDGFCLSNPEAYPFLLPKSTFLENPSHPVLTVGIRDILICHKDMSDDLVYNIIRSVSENKSVLTRQDKAYGLLSLDYTSTNTSFAFPLHEGSIHFLNKDKPGFFERYAELFGVIFSIFVVMAGGIPQVRGYIKQRKKDRIDEYYRELFELRNKYANGTDKQEALRAIKAYRDQVFFLLIEEKVSADNSFLIFLSLYEEILEEIKNS